LLDGPSETGLRQQMHTLQHAALAAAVRSHEHREPPEVKRDVRQALEVLEMNAVDHGGETAAVGPVGPSLVPQAQTLVPVPEEHVTDRNVSDLRGFTRERGEYFAQA